MEKMFKYVLSLVVLSMLLACKEWQIFSECSDAVVSEARSPDGRHVASVVERNCGATTGYSTLVVLRESSEELDVDEDHQLVFSSSGQNDVALSWKGALLLNIELRSMQGSTFRKDSSWRDIRVTYSSAS